MVHTTQVVDMNERPSRIFKNKPDSSLVKVIELVKEGKAQAAVSAGNTGGILATSLFLLGIGICILLYCHRITFASPSSKYRGRPPLSTF